MNKKINIKINNFFSRPFLQEKIEITREELGIPKKGFLNKNQKEKWLSNIGPNKAKRVNETYNNRFESERNSLKKLATDEVAIRLIREKFFYNTVDFSDIYEFQLIKINSLKQRDRIKKGLYIWVSPIANLSSVRNFISDNSENIKEYQKEAQRRLGISQDKKGRDYKIFLLSLMTKQQLRDVWDQDDKSEYKDILISKIMKSEGENITPDNVRKIISEQRKIN